MRPPENTRAAAHGQRRFFRSVSRFSSGTRRASSGLEHLHERVLVRDADVLRLLLATFEDHHGRYATNAILPCHFRRIIDVELADLVLSSELVGETLDNRREHLAGPAPRCGEV